MADARARFILTAEDRASKALRGVDSKLGALQKSATGVGRAFGLLAGGGLAAFAAKSIQSADQIGKLSTRLGISTEALSQYKFVAQQTGVEFNTLTTGLQRMVRRISEAADETGPAKDALMELGLSAKELEQLQPDQQFELLADAMARVENQGDKVRLAMKLFDTEGVSLLQTMEGGADAINALRKEADDLGITLDEHTAQTAAKAADAMGRLGAIGQALSQSLVSTLGPALGDVANFLSTNIPKAVNTAQQAWRSAQAGLLGFSQQITELVASYRRFGAAFNRFFGDEEGAKQLEENAERAQKAADAMGGAAERIVDKAIEEQKRFESSVKDSPSFETFFNQARVDEARERVASRGAGRGSRTGRGSRATSAADAQQAALEKLKQEAESLTESLRTPWEVATDNLDRYDDLLQQNLITQETWARATNEALDSVNQKADELPEKAEEIEDTWGELGTTFSSVFEDAIINGEKFTDVLLGLAKDVLPALSQRLVEAFSNSTGAQGGASGGGFDFGSIVSSLFSRDVGGPVSAGVGYSIGKGQYQEIFVPSVSGNVMPNSESQSGRSMSIGAININGVGDRVDTASANQFATDIAQNLQRQLRRNT